MRCTQQTLEKGYFQFLNYVTTIEKEIYIYIFYKMGLDHHKAYCKVRCHFRGKDNSNNKTEREN